MLPIDPAELLRRALDARAEDIWTSFPGRIESYDDSVNPPVAVIQPMIRRPATAQVGDTYWEDLPAIPNVPVLFPSGGGGAYTITWPIAKGDYVAVHVSTYSFANWRRTGTPQDPGDVRAHALGNCWAVPGLAPNGAPVPHSRDGGLVVRGSVIRILARDAGLGAHLADGTMLLEGAPILAGIDAQHFVALENLVMDNLQAVKAAFNSATAPMGGGPVTYGSTYNPHSVSATKLKAE